MSAESSHSYHRTAGYGAALPVLILALAAETAIVHVLLAGVAPRLGWLATALGAATAVWVIADHHATVSRPILLDHQTLRLRAGRRWTAVLPLADITAVQAVIADPDPGYTGLVLLGRPQWLLELVRAATVEGPCGIRRSTSRLGVSVDDPAAFRRALLAAGVRVEGEPGPSLDDFFLRLHAGVRRVLPRERLADTVARELALLAYAFLFWWLPPPPAGGAASFTVHRSGQYGAFLGVLLALATIETAVVHLLLHAVKPIAADLVLALSAYSIVWLFGDYQALRLRRVLLTADALVIRIGLRTELTVPLADLASAGWMPAGDPPRRGAPDYIRCAAIGTPELLLRLRRPVAAERILRRKKSVTIVGLTVDDGGALLAALARQSVATAPC